MMNTELNTDHPQLASGDDLWRRFFLNLLPLMLILIGAALASVQMRLQIGLGDSTIEHLFDSPIPNETGWHEPERSGTWMANAQATLTLPFKKNYDDLSFKVIGVTSEILNSLEVSVNGYTVPLTYETDNFDTRTYQGTLPDALMDSEPETLQFIFTVDEVVSPASLGLSEDTRELGIRFESLRIERSGGLITESFGFYLSIVMGALTIALALTFSTYITVDVKQKQVQFLAVIAAALVSSGLIVFLEPNITSIQIIYLIAITIVIAALTILWTPQVSTFGNHGTMFEHLKKLYDSRILLFIWVQYNIRSRYAQAFLGILWIIVQPLMTALILTFVFSQIFRKFDTGEAPYISFYLAAIIAWGLFSQGITNGAISLTNSAGLLTQVYFPREILILVRLGEVLVDTFFTFVAMIILNAILGIFPNIHYLYLPILLIIQLSFLMGLMFFASYLSMMIRDIPQLIAIIIQFMFYLTPIIYPLQAIPDRYIIIVLLNPMAALIDAYRNIILFNTAPDFTTLYYPIVIGGVLFYTGYVFFKKNEKRVTDYI